MNGVTLCHVRRVSFCVVTLSLIATFGYRAISADPTPSTPQVTTPQVVEGDMHEFMEYVFQPVYLRLKSSMAAEPTDNVGWKAIKSDALILAEAGNLLLMRTPAEKAAEWREHSTVVRDWGGQLYQAAKKKDYSGSRQHYQAMLLKCNSCHDVFAEGEHQLAP